MQIRSNFLHQTVETAVTFFYPAQCRNCDEQLGYSTVPYICDTCWNRIKLVEPPWCEICGISTTEDKCDECATKPPQYGKLRTIAVYEAAIQKAIHLFKFEKKITLATPLAQLIITHLPDDCIIADYDYILPIPIHKKRLKERTFNQATLIANQLAKAAGIRIEKDALVRHKNTSPQSSLDKEARQKNIIGAFKLHKKDVVQGKHILVIDDVYTTGATVQEAVKVLWTADPIEVDVLTLTRTINT